MKKVIITKGLPASGKSTWAKETILASPGSWKRVNKDDLRSMLDGGHFAKGNEDFVLQIRDLIILESLKQGKHVIVDDTNLHPKHENQIRALVEKYCKQNDDQIQIEIKNFDLPIEECIKRDLVRPNSVGEKVIRKMYNLYLSDISGRKPFWLEQNLSLPKAIMCDLDGTLAILNRNPYDASQADKDELNIPVANILRNYVRLNYKIILISGREEEHREPTLKFLKKFSIPYDHLILRPTGDRRKDAIIKKEFFEQLIKDKYYVDFVLDDRNQVVDMWREIGLLCCQVAPGDF